MKKSTEQAVIKFKKAWHWHIRSQQALSGPSNDTARGDASQAHLELGSEKIGLISAILRDDTIPSE